MARSSHTKRVLRAGLVALLLVATPNVAFAGPWTPEPGHGYAKIWVKWLFGLGYHDGSGSTRDYLDGYHELFLATYGEVGLVEDEHAGGLALFWHTDLVRLFFLGDQSHVAPGDPALGLRYRFVAIDRFVAAVEGSVRAPLASDDPQQPVVADEPGTPVVGDLRIGSGVWDFGARLSAGYGWDHVYVAAAGGWLARTGGFDHAVEWSVEGGGDAGDFGIRGRITGHHAVDTGDAPRHDSPSGIGNGTSYVGIALEGDYTIADRFIVGLTVEGGLFLVRRQSGGPVTSLYFATTW